MKGRSRRYRIGEVLQANVFGGFCRKMKNVSLAHLFKLNELRIKKKITKFSFSLLNKSVKLNWAFSNITT